MGYQELMKECWDQDPLKRPQVPNVLARLEEIYKTTEPTEDGIETWDSKDGKDKTWLFQELKRGAVDSKMFASLDMQKQDIKEVVTPSTSSSIYKGKFVREFLSPLDLLEYCDIFLENGYDNKVAISNISTDDLNYMKIKRGHHGSLLGAIRLLQNQDLKSSGTGLVQSSLATFSPIQEQVEASKKNVEKEKTKQEEEEMTKKTEEAKKTEEVKQKK